MNERHEFMSKYRLVMKNIIGLMIIVFSKDAHIILQTFLWDSVKQSTKCHSKKVEKVYGWNWSITTHSNVDQKLFLDSLGSPKIWPQPSRVPEFLRKRDPTLLCSTYYPELATLPRDQTLGQETRAGIYMTFFRFQLYWFPGLVLQLFWEFILHREKNW